MALTRTDCVSPVEFDQLVLDRIMMQRCGAGVDIHSALWVANQWSCALAHLLMMPNPASFQSHPSLHAADFNNAASSVHPSSNLQKSYLINLRLQCNCVPICSSEFPKPLSACIAVVNRTSNDVVTLEEHQVGLSSWCVQENKLGAYRRRCHHRLASQCTLGKCC